MAEEITLEALLKRIEAVEEQNGVLVEENKKLKAAAKAKMPTVSADAVSTMQVHTATRQTASEIVKPS